MLVFGALLLKSKGLLTDKLIFKKELKQCREFNQIIF